ncbi:MAG: DUF4340 domain-containing protein [Nannocystaceae bacterium]
MNRTTSLMGIIAAASLTGAVAMRPVDVETPVFEDTGQPLFEAFTDPTHAASLEVREWDADGARLKTFNVKLAEGKWTIPSHNNYPADGTEQMGKAAASFVGVKKDLVRSNLPEDHDEFGVLDPENTQLEGTGKGQRIVIHDEAGTVLVDVIVGKEVPGKKGYRFVRYPDKDRVYAVRMDLDISTKFTDWIEEDLLDFDKDKATLVSSNSYRIDEKTQRVVDGVPMLFDLAPKEEGSSDTEWAASSDTRVPKDKEVNPSKVRQVLSAIDRLKIVGVRPRPRGLRELSDQSMGFFLSRGAVPKLFGNEGELSVVQDDGVVYTLYFGEITYDTGLALTAGGSDVAGNKVDGETGDKSKSNRYLLVQIGYAEDSDSARDDVAAEEKDPSEAGDGKAEESEEKNEGDEGKKKPELKGLARAKDLQQRFDSWFYVISNASFEQLRKAPEDFLRDRKDDK